MTLLKNVRLGLLHVAVAISFVAINGVLNRIMIYDLGILATIVAGLIVLPYLFSPAQVWLGQYSDTHPLFGYRRTPYIMAGILLTMAGMVLTPFAALLMADAFMWGLMLGVVAFGSWGIGYNLAVVSYLSLASDLSEEDQRSRTIAVMWFMMILSIIISALVLGRLLEPYSEAQLIRVFAYAALVALGLAGVGLIGLEPRYTTQKTQSRESQKAALAAVMGNPQARLFFIYLVLMLAAILGQDVLLEPFGAEAFGMSVERTTQLTALWGVMTLIALLFYGFVLSRIMSKRTGAAMGGVIAAVGLVLIATSGAVGDVVLFQAGIATLGFGTGIATSTNLALMLDMTTPEQAGLFIGAWGVADAAARGVGMMLGSVVRDVMIRFSGDAVFAYVTVFTVEAAMLFISLVLLSRVNVVVFQNEQPTLADLVAITGDV